MSSPMSRTVPAEKLRDGSLQKLRRLAATKYGARAFRPGQLELMKLVLRGKSALGILPTGGGKSLCYQLPALLLPKATVVVSPLISLMQDQVEKLADAGVDATSVNSTLSERQTREEVEGIEAGRDKLVYVTPERLEKPDFLASLKEGGVSLFVVDEAHCISQWGHDFRPSYLSLRHAIESLGRPPVLALTATATSAVASDILRQLGIEDATVLDYGIERENLRFCVIPAVNDDVKKRRLTELLRQAKGIGIVYVATVRAANELRGYLLANGILAAHYHGKMKARDRERIQQEFMDNRFKVVVATKAFGLGIDKPDIRFVVHYHFPDSIESYYQEAGRAGRDGKPATATLLYRLEDKRIQSFFLGGRYPTRAESARLLDTVRRLLERPENRVGVTLGGIVKESRLPLRRARVILSQLDAAGLVTRKRRIRLAREVDGSDELDRILSDYEDRHRSDREKLEAMMKYAQTTKCRTRAIKEYFGYPVERDCGICDNCMKGAARPVLLDRGRPIAA